MERKKYISLFACCIPVKGASRGTICDLQRNNYYYIPNEIIDLFLEDFKENPIEEVISLFDEEGKKTIKSYLDLVLENELGFLTNEPDSFPKIDLKYKSSSTITNSIIELDNHSTYDVLSVVKQLDKLGCKAIQLRLNSEFPNEFITDVIKTFEGSGIYHVDLMMKYNHDYSLKLSFKFIKDLAQQFPRVQQILLSGSPIEKNKELDVQGDLTLVTFMKKEIDFSSNCGCIHPSYFSLDIRTFTESKLNNNCLNQKISINAKGEIVNCPSLNKAYGKTEDIDIASVLEQGEIKDLWSINKDQIDVCKDCEFRYICTDCRAFTQDNSNILSKPLKCSYDPYKMEWSEAADNPSSEFYIKKQL